MSDSSLIADFADEAREHLEELEGALLRLESDPANADLLNTIFRSMHTIKGASEYLGFERIAGLTHHLETILDLFREGQLTVDKVAVDVMIDARDRVETLVGEIETAGRESSPIDDMMTRIGALASDSPADDAQTSIYTEESDTELFDIFSEQLVDGVTKLVSAVTNDADALAELVSRLSASANYMGYDALVEAYDELAGALASTNTPGVAVATTVERIRKLFPGVDALDAIDTQALSAIDEPEPELELANDDVLVGLDDGVAERQDDEIDAEPELSLDMDPILDGETGAGEDVDLSLTADFADESREHLEVLEGSLLRLEHDPKDADLLNTIFRSMHTIKGASEYLGFERIAELTHRLETFLDRFRDGQLTVDKVSVDLMIDARDRLETLVGEIETSGRESSAIDDLMTRVEMLESGSAPDDGSASEASVYTEESDSELFDIFAEQLVEGVTQLVAAAIGDAATLNDLVSRLSASANYMGYDGLVAVYDDLAGALPSTDSPAAVVATTVERIRQLFPSVTELAGLDTSGLSGPKPITQTDVETTGSTSGDIADALASLPAIDENQREGLLSRSLDEVFSNMHNGDRHPVSDDTDDGVLIELDVFTPTESVSAAPQDEITDDGDDEAMALLMDFEAGNASEAVSPSQSPIDSIAEPESVETPESIETPEPVEAVDVPETIKEPEPVETPESVEASEPETALWPEVVSTTPMADTTRPTDDTDTTLAVPDFNVPAAPPEQPSAPADVSDSTGPFAARSTVRRSIRVEAQKIDDLMNQVGELVVNRSAFAQLFADMRSMISDFNQRFAMEKADQRLLTGLSGRLSDATTVLGRITGELQEQVMKVRMLPISRLFNRYPRLVHDLLKNTDKKIQLQFRGEETELDRMVIEQLADPMIHIIRNAVDHGIESRHERIRKGKPEKGVLMLEAYHEGGNVVIEVIDDGKGIDLSRIREKAIEKKLADRETLEQMDQQQLIEMIFLPGFSTTDEVTHTSGRGVGMDVVKQSLEKINGNLNIDTRQDVGTRIRIKIPLTLAIIPALMVRCGGGHFTIPLSVVDETLRIDQGEIFSVDGSEVMDLDDEPLPLVNLADLLRLTVRAKAPRQGRRFVVVVNAVSGRTGFIVDALLGRQEVVIKPLEDYLQEDSGFSGATILGDGGISLILNVDDLVIMAKAREAERKLAAALL